MKTVKSHDRRMDENGATRRFVDAWHRAGRGESFCELRFVLPDGRSAEVRRRIAEQVARLDPADEEAAMRWIEAVSRPE